MAGRSFQTITTTNSQPARSPMSACNSCGRRRTRNPPVEQKLPDESKRCRRYTFFFSCIICFSELYFCTPNVNTVTECIVCPGFSSVVANFGDSANPESVASPGRSPHSSDTSRQTSRLRSIQKIPRVELHARLRRRHRQRAPAGRVITLAARCSRHPYRSAPSCGRSRRRSSAAHSCRGCARRSPSPCGNQTAFPPPAPALP